MTMYITVADQRRAVAARHARERERAAGRRAPASAVAEGAGPITASAAIRRFDQAARAAHLDLGRPWPCVDNSCCIQGAAITAGGGPSPASIRAEWFRSKLRHALGRPTSITPTVITGGFPIGPDRFVTISAPTPPAMVAAAVAPALDGTADPSQAQDDRRHLAELAAALLGPLLAGLVGRFVADELSPPPAVPLPPEVVDRWRRSLVTEVGPDLEQLLAVDAADAWAARGLPLPPTDSIDRAATAAADGVLRGADDLAETLARSAAGADGSAALEVLLGEAHQAEVAASLADVGADALYGRLLATGVNAGDLTGRRMWVVADPQNSRHGALDGVVAERGGGWVLDGAEVGGPRDDPADVAQWCGCQCVELVEDAEGDWL